MSARHASRKRKADDVEAGPSQRSPKNQKTSGGPTAPTSETTPKEAEEKHRLVFALDYGTKTLSVVWKVVREGDDINEIDMFAIKFDEKTSAPQKLAFVPKEGLLWGYDVDTAVGTGQIGEEDVIELLKLLLYKDHENAHIVQEVESQLGDRSVGDVLELHLAAIIKYAREMVLKEPPFQFSREELEAMEVQLMLAVPLMWKPPANIIMTDAADVKNVSRVQLVYEPQVAAAYLIHKFKDHLTKQLAVGDIILVADIGGGTGDFVSYVVTTGTGEGAAVGLRIFKQAEGSLCGSQYVNEEFKKWAEMTIPQFDQVCRDLGLTKRAFLKKASNRFERDKVEFKDAASTGVKHLTVAGAKDAKLEYYTIKLTGQDFTHFFDPVVAKVKACIKSQMEGHDKTKVIMIPGGFGRSHYVREQLRLEFPGIEIRTQTESQLGAEDTVCRGALLRFKDVDIRGIDAKSSFGIPMDAPFDRNLHGDAMFQVGQEMADGKVLTKRKRNPAIIKPLPYFDNKDSVCMRWMPLIEQGESSEPGQERKASRWQEFPVKIGQKSITLQVYWTDRDDMAEHSAMLDGSGFSLQDGKLKDSIEPFGKELEMQLPDLPDLGYELEQQGDGDEQYTVYTMITVRGADADFTVDWQLARAGDYKTLEDVEYQDPQTYKICKATHSPFARLSIN